MTRPRRDMSGVVGAEVARAELGCAGHFVAARSCNWRRHTQVGTRYRVSTVGDLWFARGGDAERLPEHMRGRQTLGIGEADFFETMVFRTTGEPVEGSEGCGCLVVADWGGVEQERYATAGEAQGGHEAMVEKYAAIAAQEGA